MRVVQGRAWQALRGRLVSDFCQHIYVYFKLGTPFCAGCSTILYVKSFFYHTSRSMAQLKASGSILWTGNELLRLVN